MPHERPLSPDRRVGGVGAVLMLGALLAMAAPATAAAALAAPMLQDVTPSAGSLGVAFAITGCAPPGCLPTNVEISLDGGTTWTPRVPAAITSPLALTGLTDGTTYLLALRLVDAAGAGPASRVVAVTPGVGVTTPARLAVMAIDGDEITLLWDPPAVGAHPDDYLVEGGLASGQTLAAIATGDDTTVLRVRLADGVYFVRVRARALATTSAPSNEVRVVRGASEPPSAPASLLGTTAGAALALSWTPTFSGGESAALWLVVSGPLSGVVPLGAVETFQHGAVPAGTYDFQVVATNAAGASPPSNTVRLTFPGVCSALPAAPQRLRASASGTTLTFAWNAPDAGEAVIAYRVMVGTPGDRAPMAAGRGGPRYVFSVPVAGRRVSGTLPPDFYSLFVAAVNACGVGAMAGPVSIDTR